MSRIRLRFRAFSLVEMLLAFAILVLTLVPMLELMTTTTRGTKITRDYLIGYNLAQMVFENVMNAATVDAKDAFDNVVTQFNRPGAGNGGPNGCPGASITELARGNVPGDPAPGVLIADDGNAAFSPTGGEAHFRELFTRYSYTCTITPSPASADTVTGADSKPTLARVDIEVFWRDQLNQCTSIKFSDYIAKRRF